MFPDIKEEIIVDFLLKYENDINIVTEILLDSLSFGEIYKQKETENKSQKTYQVKSLQNLCVEAMEKLEVELEKLYEDKRMSDLNDNELSNDVEISLNEDESYDQTKNNESSIYKQSTETGLSEEPLFNLCLNKEFLGGLIRIFGNEDEEKYLDGNI